MTSFGRRFASGREREELKERRLADLREKVDRSLEDPSPPLDEDAAFAYLDERFGER